ncbi:MAG: GntR family transcriptional regulator, partial [Tardiphaga sp.]
LRSLEAERLIEIIPNRGPLVPVLTWEHATEIYHVRALLEGEAACLAARRATGEDLRHMRASLAAFGRAVRAEDAAGEIKSTAEFYGHILRVCGNRVIEQTLSGLLARINFLRGKSMSQRGRARLSLREMKAIYQAIEAKDGAMARAAAIRHVDQAHVAAKAAFDAVDTKRSAA